MASCVVASIGQFQVLDAVVPLVTVSVVNQLVRPQLTAQMLFHDEPVFIVLSAVDPHGLVAVTHESLLSNFLEIKLFCVMIK